jgi:hypothetical protein
MAAEQGHEVAAHELSSNYYIGAGVEYNRVKGSYWRRIAAENGYELALESLISGAENGDSDNQFDLGLLCYNGKGVKKNEKIAAKWVRKAAEQGCEKAMNFFGRVGE